MTLKLNESEFLFRSLKEINTFFHNCGLTSGFQKKRIVAVSSKPHWLQKVVKNQPSHVAGEILDPRSKILMLY
jgi:hypothetical protein